MRKARLRRDGLKRSSLENGAGEGRAEEAGQRGRRSWVGQMRRAVLMRKRSESRKDFETLARNWNPGAGRQSSSPKARKPLPHPCLGRLLPRADACALSYLAHSVCSFWTSSSGHQQRTLA